jgi:hypothetical protein
MHVVIVMRHLGEITVKNLIYHYIKLYYYYFTNTTENVVLLYVFEFLLSFTSHNHAF